MKKTVAFAVILRLFLALLGCSHLGGDRVEALKSWSFQYNEGTNDYSVFFGLLNEKDEYVAADVEADIRIVDENGNELYSATHAVTKDDFGTYMSKAAGQQYLADIRIGASELTEGTSAKGTVYLTVYKDDSVRFDEVSCKAYYCLPVKSVTLTMQPLPTEVEVMGFDGKTESVIQIDNVTYDFDGSVFQKLTITLAGVKVYANEESTYKSPYDIIGYKLYDSRGYVVDSGSIILRALAPGDRFKDESIVVYDVTPGETYVLKVVEYDW